MRADATVGHDLGELAALEAAGALPDAEEARIALARALVPRLRDAPGSMRLDRALFDGAGLRAPRGTVYSCGTAGAFPSDPVALAEVAAQGWDGPIRFRETIERMHGEGVRIFLEAGPGAALCRLVGEILEGRDHVSVAVDRRGEPSLVTLHHALARIAAEGVPLDLARLHRDRGSRTLDAATWRPPAATKPSHTVATGAQAPQLDATAYIREVGTLGRAAPDRVEPPVAAVSPAGSRGIGDDPVVAGYMESMSRFLATQEEIGRHLVALAGGAPVASTIHRARPASGAPAPSAAIVLAESWLPPPAVQGTLRGRCVFTRRIGRPPSLAAREDWLEAWADLVLSPAERERWTRLDRSRDGPVRWLSGRTAAKDAVRRLLAGGVSLADVIVAGERGERPTVQVAGREDRPAISIAHHRQLAVSVACDAPGSSIGIDVEEIRPPGEDLREAALAPDEAARVPPGDAWFFRAWAAKEAYAKALGSGVIPDPTRYAVIRVDPGSGAVELQTATTRAVAMTWEIAGESPEETLALAVCQC
jgi:phosphopantetheinyl transferase